MLFIQDAKRFLRENKSEIEKELLQVYHSALLLSPTLSMVRIQYWNEAPARLKIRPTSHVIEDWDPLIKVSEAHAGNVNALACSQDGKLLASASDNKTIWLWDPFTGTCQNTLDGHSAWVHSVAFSADRRFLASASGDKTIKL